MDRDDGGNKGSRDTFGPNHDSLDQDKGLSERILESAVGLVQSGLGGSKDDAPASLSKALAEGEKLAPSSSSSSAYSRVTESSTGLGHTHGAGASNIYTSIGESLRSVRSDSSDNIDVMGVEERAHMPAQESLFYSPDPSSTSWDKTDPKGKKIAHEQPQNLLEKPDKEETMEAAWSHHNHLSQSQEYHDGVEVSQLLSDPMFDPLHAMDHESLYDGRLTLSKEETEAAQLFLGRLSTGEEYQSMGLDSSRADPSSLVSKSGTDLSHKLESALSLSVDRQSLQEIDTFFDDLMNYHEDVWGYAQPLVEDARKEVKSTLPGQAPDGPALQRLRMIFAHMNN